MCVLYCNSGGGVGVGDSLTAKSCVTDCPSKRNKSIHVHMTDVYTYSEMALDIRCRLADANREIYLRNTAVRHMEFISHERVVI